jgi:large conductance mechanosensitive channel
MARRAASSFLSDFKDFINKGNVVDLAVAVVIGGAFSKVVDAIVSLVMTSLLEPALKAAQVDSISAWPAGAVMVLVEENSTIWSMLPSGKSSCRI